MVSHKIQGPSPAELQALFHQRPSCRRLLQSMQPTIHEALARAPRAALEMNAIRPEAVPAVRVADILRKQHFNLIACIGILRERAGNQPRAGRIEHEELAPKHPWYRSHHLFSPLGMLLGSDAILYDRIEKWVARCCTKSIVTDFPVHPIAVAKESVNGQFFERKYATEAKQILEIGRQEYVGIKIETAKAIDRKIPEKVVALNAYGKRVEHGSVLGELSVNELLDLGIIEKQVLEIRMEQTQACGGRLRQQRQVRALVCLYNPPWNFLVRHSSLPYATI